MGDPASTATPLIALASGVAVLAAALFAVSTSVQHHAAETAPSSAGGVVGLVRHLLGRPTWLLGQFVGVLGLGLHAAALHYGRIAVVQPIIISGIIFAVPTRAAISRRLPSQAEIRAVALTGAGLAVFLVASNPTAGTHIGIEMRAAVQVAVCVVIALAAAATAWVTRQADRRAFYLGVTAGVLFGLVAGLLKMVLQILADEGATQVLLAWQTWLLVVFGVAGGVVNQLAYRSSRLSASMPVLNIVDGLVALAFGYFVFHEIPRHSVLFLVIEVIAMSAVAVGLLLTARLEDEPLSPRRES
ncbi:MAG TPA: DMT family transporter [Nocardioidaceae bacterium]|nr:DMT family transporter [Nocardioidaceae bacterium]